jgi:hypothetical protein
MRRFILAAGALACLSLAACSNSEADASQVDTAPKKSLAHQAQMYQGQEQVQSIQAATVEAGPDGGVVLKANATEAGAGFINPGFLPRIYAATPPDGIYEVDVVADRPATPGAATATPVEIKGAWDKYKDGRVKGIKFISKTNAVTAMLPSGGSSAAGK